MDKQASVVQLKTQLVKEGHTRNLLAETDLMTLRIHCYAPGIGENALHSHTKEDHILSSFREQRNSIPDGKETTSSRPGRTMRWYCRQAAIISSKTREPSRW